MFHVCQENSFLLIRVLIHVGKGITCSKAVESFYNIESLVSGNKKIFKNYEKIC